MAMHYHDPEVLGETLFKVLEALINESIVDKSLSFNTYQEGHCTFHVVKNDDGKVLSILHFLCDDQSPVVRLKQFLEIAEKVGLNSSGLTIPFVIAIGQKDVMVWQLLMKHGVDFCISTDQNVIDSFRLADIDLSADLTLDIDNYIQYLKLSEAERIKLAHLLLNDVQSIVEGVVRRYQTTASKTDSF